MSVDIVAKFVLSRDRVILILDLFTMVPRYLKTKFKEELSFTFVYILNILLLLLPPREISTKNISWG